MLKRDKVMNIIKTKRTIILGSIVLLFLMFWLNCTINWAGIVDKTWFESWQADSESLIWTRINDINTYGLLYKFGLLGDYTSQLGLSGTFYGIINKVLSVCNSTSILYAVNTLLLCLSLFYILYWIYEEFDILTAALVYLLLFCNQWIIVSARNLYWVTVTFLLPFVCSIYFLRKEEKTGICCLKHWITWAFILIFVRAACGFEMISLAMINLETPLFYYAFKNRMKRKTFITRFVSLGTAAILGFIICMGLHIIQLGFYFDGNFKHAIEVTLGNIAYRTGAFTNSNNYSNIGSVRDSLEASKITVLKLYFNSGNPLLLGMRMNTITVLTGMSFLLCCISENIFPNIARIRHQLISWSILLLISALGPLSWYVLASAHSYVHVHINYMLWSMPTIILITALVSKIAIEVVKSLWNRNRKFIFIGLGISLFIVSYFYIDSTKIGTKYLGYLKTDAYLIEQNSQVEIYEMNGRLYAVIDKKKSDIPINCELRFNNNLTSKEHFSTAISIKNSSLNMPFWVKKNVVILGEVANLGDFVKFSQTIDNSILWEVSIETKIPDSLAVSDLTDDNWTKGYNNLEKCFLTNYIEENQRLIGKMLQLPDGSTTEIIDVISAQPYQYIYTSVDLSQYKQTRSYVIIGTNE